MKKKILDLMIDFETFGRQVDSVPINLAVVAFDRYSEGDPFVLPDVEHLDKDFARFHQYPHLRMLASDDCMMAKSRFALYTFNVTSCLVDGMKVERETQAWWTEQTEKAKETLMPDMMPEHPSVILNSLCEFVATIKKQVQAEEVCVWAQGSDFDIAKLRYLMDKYGYTLRFAKECGITHTSWRDARTAILEMGAQLYNGKRGFSADLESGTLFKDGDSNDNPNLEDFHEVYEHIVPIEVWARQDAHDNHGMSNYLLSLAMEDAVHNSIYDCMRSIYNVWWLTKALETQMM